MWRRALRLASSQLNVEEKENLLLLFIYLLLLFILNRTKIMVGR